MSGMERSVMADAFSRHARLDRGLIALLDRALALAADRLAPEQRADLWRQVEPRGWPHVERLCSPAVQGVLLGERPRVNPDGGRVGETTGEPPAREGGATVAEGSAKLSGTPTL
jgi:hypothetical protein